MTELPEPSAWQAVKTAAGSALVLRPSWLPDRLRGSGVLVEYAYVTTGELRYRIGYRAADTLLTLAAGAVNSGPPTSSSVVTVRSLAAQYSTTSTWPERQITWTEAGVMYSIQARGVSEEELTRIAGGLVTVP